MGLWMESMLARHPFSEGKDRLFPLIFTLALPI